MKVSNMRAKFFAKADQNNDQSCVVSEISEAELALVIGAEDDDVCPPPTRTTNGPIKTDDTNNDL